MQKREREPQKEKTHANKTHSARERENDRRDHWHHADRRNHDRVDRNRDLADLDRDRDRDRNLAFICSDLMIFFRSEEHTSELQSP